LAQKRMENRAEPNLGAIRLWKDTGSRFWMNLEGQLVMAIDGGHTESGMVLTVPFSDKNMQE